MRSVKERIEKWESKNNIEQVTTNPAYNLVTSSVVVNGNPNVIVPNRQSVTIENRMTEMEQARKLLQAMQVKTNNSNLLPNALPPKQSMARLSQHKQRSREREDNRTSMNRMTRMKNPEDSSIAGNYQKQFLNIRGTLNLDMRNQPPVPRNTVDVNYNEDILKPSKVRELMGMSADKNKFNQPNNLGSNNSNSLSPHGGYFKTLENSQHPTLKSEVIKIDKGLHYRTQKIINTLFGQQEYDEFGYLKSQPIEGPLRMTNQIGIEGSGVPKFRSEGIPLKGIMKNKNPKHYQNFDNL